MDDRDAALLLDMQIAAREAISFVDGMDMTAFKASRLHQNAVIRSLEIIGEAAGKVSAPICAANPDIPWREMIGMRNHGYAEVRLDIIWIVVTEKLPALLSQLDPLCGEVA